MGAARKTHGADELEGESVGLGDETSGLRGALAAGRQDGDGLPADASEKKRFDAPKVAPGTRVDIIERDTRSTAISMGFPIKITRTSGDWPALAVAAS